VAAHEYPPRSHAGAVMLTLTIHSGELRRYAVRCSSSTGQEDTDVVVFACDARAARKAAVDKQVDNWLRHQNLKTRWRAHQVREC
jgi:hypothetical protein